MKGEAERVSLYCYNDDRIDEPISLPGEIFQNRSALS